MIYRLTREEKDISLELVAEKTKIQKKFLLAIEDNCWEALPGEVYLRGFLRIYAKYLGLNGQEIVDIYNRQMKKDTTVDPVTNVKSKKKFWTGGGLLLIALLAAVLVYFLLKPS